MTRLLHIKKKEAKKKRLTPSIYFFSHKKTLNLPM